MKNFTIKCLYIFPSYTTNHTISILCATVTYPQTNKQLMNNMTKINEPQIFQIKLNVISMIAYFYECLLMFSSPFTRAEPKQPKLGLLLDLYHSHGIHIGMHCTHLFISCDSMSNFFTKLRLSGTILISENLRLNTFLVGV